VRNISTDLLGTCESKGNITNYGGISYLCDPPNWNSNGKNGIDWLMPVVKFIVLQATL
jgi:hypothetical protein